MRDVKAVVTEAVTAVIVLATFGIVGCSQKSSAVAPGSVPSAIASTVAELPAKVEEAVKPDSIDKTPCTKTIANNVIKHVFLIVLENKSYERTFGKDSKSQLKKIADEQGCCLPTTTVLATTAWTITSRW
jgi:hypothetical protein